MLLLAFRLLQARAPPTGSLSGKVTDTTGAAVANATVTVTNTESGRARTATAGADGTWRFTELSPGKHTVKVEAAGCKTLELTAATVGGTAVRMDGMLQSSGPASAIS